MVSVERDQSLGVHRHEQRVIVVDAAKRDGAIHLFGGVPGRLPEYITLQYPSLLVVMEMLVGKLFGGNVLTMKIVVRGKVF